MLRFLLIVFTLSVSTVVQGSVVIMGTRVVYPAAQKSINIRLNNENSSPALVQSWLDTGDATVTPDSVRVPFIITPPIFRMDPKSGQTIRVVYTGESLPTDRESLFYLNVLDIPAKPENKDSGSAEVNNNYLQLAVRSRIKFFFRPDDLKITPNDAYQKVSWHQEGKRRIKAINPTPYYITYNKIEVVQNKDIMPVEQSGMVEPFSSKVFTLKNNSALANKVTWTIVNDYGGLQQGESVLE
ncbi:TPA: molecular chaperone [Escherichia coli]|nr:molecular chaperone [Escherichia coli]